MKTSTVVVSLLVVLWAGGVSGQGPASLQAIPVVAHTSGLGSPPTYWASDVTIHNVNDWMVTVGMMFFEEGKAGDFSQVVPVIKILGPRQTITYEDVLSSVFGYARNLKGGLLIDSGYLLPLGNPAGSRIIATSRTYNTGDPRGTFGQTVTASQAFLNFSGAPSVVTGARHDDRFRSNLGIANISPVGVTIHWAVRVASNTVIASGSKNLLPMSMGQWSFSSLGIPPTSGTLTVDLWLDAGEVTDDPCAVAFANGFLAYVSKVDGNPEGTGDAEYIHAVPTVVHQCWLDEIF